MSGKAGRNRTENAFYEMLEVAWNENEKREC